jgi:cold shock CspA family protein
VRDYARRRRGKTKIHEPAPLARVMKLFPLEDYGFLATHDGRELYFHKNSVLQPGFEQLEIGTQVHFVEELGDKGPQASTVRLVGR